jgi:hypothetical protein
MLADKLLGIVPSRRLHPYYLLRSQYASIPILITQTVYTHTQATQV